MNDIAACVYDHPSIELCCGRQERKKGYATMKEPISLLLTAFIRRRQTFLRRQAAQDERAIFNARCVVEGIRRGRR